MSSSELQLLSTKKRTGTIPVDLGSCALLHEDGELERAFARVADRLQELVVEVRLQLLPARGEQEPI